MVASSTVQPAAGRRSAATQVGYANGLAVYGEHRGAG